jgi:hypothetical protein
MTCVVRVGEFRVSLIPMSRLADLADPDGTAPEGPGGEPEAHVITLREIEPGALEGKILGTAKKIEGAEGGR